MAELTVAALRKRHKNGDRWVSDGAVRGSGALWARIGASGTSLYFRYTDGEGGKRAIALGGYDEDGAKGLTLAQARERAGELSKLYRGGVRDLHGHLEREKQAAEQARQAAEDAARRAAEDAQRGTLKQLLDAYVGHLERQGKQAARDVRSIFDTHVLKAAQDQPDLTGRKAADLTVDDFVPVIARVVEAGKGRTAAKLRSYLRAAYSLAMASKADPVAPMALKSFGITDNPVARTAAKTLRKFNRARERNLSAPELGALLRRLDALPISGRRDALQLALLLGGQRPTQLLRVKIGDVDIAGATITLLDPKGTRAQPRVHRLPLVRQAASILERRLQHAGEDGALFVSTVETLSALVHELSAQMVEAGEAVEPFRLADLRRTCETMLAGLRVSSDIRAQLLSHGLSGVQVRHYDRHDYALEKRQALEKWARHLITLKADKKAQVLPLAQRPAIEAHP